MNSELRHLSALRYFEAAARLGSYSKAALELSITQAAVSQRLRQLEDELACKLFVRKGRNMLLTAEGLRLYETVSVAFKSIVDGLNATQAEPIEGVLSVVTSPSFASRWLMPRLWRFSLAFPKTPIRVSSSNQPNIDLSGDFDIAIGEVNCKIDDTLLTCQQLFDEPVFPVCSPELAKSMKLSQPDQLLKCWLVSNISSHHFSWEEWFKKAGVVVDDSVFNWMEVETFDMGINAVVAGHGVCAGTDSLAGDFIERGLLVKPFDISLSPGVEYSAVYHADSIRKSRILVFVDWLKAEAALQSMS
ncbi:LysR family transcriptional regulator [Alginatibacterium sediminis]|uniref:LysR family transcriptional regulator n=1 Tax=Alginatibacterium sediminis TaxID=2164068 RepID=A0A420EDH4_9ALTE|nr:LysR substrate-binding domain-containing protein [Alginatibacterium sediminis]RKF18716.1 LysR family transcriptional regulator [Alginatibacterium sediminis]